MINKAFAAAGTGKSGFTLSLKGRALRLLSGREQSRLELERKLGAHEETPGPLAAVLDDVEAKDFISPTRVMESVINRRQAKMGASRIKRELQGKGLDIETVAQAMQTLKSTELERANEVWRKKFDGKTEAGTSPADRAKQMRFLAARGFGSDVIRQVVARVKGDKAEGD